jgi:hypothetical protein
MMRCERLERLAKTAASGQRTKPPRLSQRPEARHSLQMADREAHGLSVFRTLVPRVIQNEGKAASV